MIKSKKGKKKQIENLKKRNRNLKLKSQRRWMFLVKTSTIKTSENLSKISEFKASTMKPCDQTNIP